MTSRLLNGIRAIELCEVWAGPTAGSLLGDLGADVVKVESFPRNSMSRPLAAPIPGPGEGPVWERSHVHHLANRNKRNIALNIRTEAGTAVMRDLLASADIFFEGYSAGTVDRMGFDWETAHAINPRLIYVALPGWGARGPYEGYVTLGSGLDAAGGHTVVRGYPERPMEETSPIFHSDATGALAVVFAVITALHRREQTGLGSYIDISQIEVLNWHLPGQVAEWAMNRRLPERLGNRDPLIVPHGCFRAAGGEAGDDDSWVVVAAETDRQWAGLASAMGHPEWAERGHSWSTIPGRLGARDAVHEAVRAFVATGPAEHIAATVQPHGAIAAPVLAPWSLLADPQHSHREWMQTVEHKYVGVQMFPGFPWRVSPDAASWDRPTGLVGEYNAEVLAGLGYSADAIERLEADGVIGARYGV
jgi:crotonobetainyl-CoA:carnitine CoA-transferase CaiB-like acyl-CoA transferase